METRKLLEVLMARLPELEWQLKKYSAVFAPKRLPKGLFRQHFDAPVTAYISEIRADIASLKFQSAPRAEHYLSLKINQKINVLVALCRSYAETLPQEEVFQTGIEKIHTRQQYLQDLEAQITGLNQQKTALEKTMSGKKVDCVSILALQKELGQLEKKLTLLREAFAGSSVASRMG